MKRKFTLIVAVMCALLTATTIKSYAQTPAPFTGPSDNTTAAPATAGTVMQVLCAGGAISLRGPADPTGQYQWYKVNPQGASVLVKNGTSGDNAYTETAAGAGYYTYKLVQTNANGCTSTTSDPFQIYVLPAINATVVSSSPSVCEKSQTIANLTITGLNASYSYTYQWTRNGVDISGATTNTYVASEANTSATPISYGVKISYTLNPSCTQAATPVSINVNPVPTKPVITLN